MALLVTPGAPDHPVGDKPARQRFILGSVWWTVPGTLLLVAAAYHALPPLAGMQDAGARVLLALRWLLVALLPYVAVCLWITTARFLEGAHDPLARLESERLQVHCRVMQNTLEQLAWFAPCLLALASWLAPDQARIVPILCVAFAAARLLYWWGYLRQGTIGRAPGVQVTLTLNLALLLHVLALAIRQLASA